MLSSQPFVRDDTFLGVCHALGEQFRFNPTWLRVLVGPLVVWNPLLVTGIYSALGAAIFLLYWAVPDPVQPAKSMTAEAVADPALGQEPAEEVHEFAVAA